MTFFKNQVSQERRRWMNSWNVWHQKLRTDKMLVRVNVSNVSVNRISIKTEKKKIIYCSNFGNYQPAKGSTLL